MNSFCCRIKCWKLNFCWNSLCPPIREPRSERFWLTKSVGAVWVLGLLPPTTYLSKVTNFRLKRKFEGERSTRSWSQMREKMLMTSSSAHIAPTHCYLQPFALSITFQESEWLVQRKPKILPTNGITVVFAHFCQPNYESKNSERQKPNTLEEMI